MKDPIVEKILSEMNLMETEFDHELMARKLKAATKYNSLNQDVILIIDGYEDEPYFVIQKDEKFVKLAGNVREYFMSKEDFMESWLDDTVKIYRLDKM